MLDDAPEWDACMLCEYWECLSLGELVVGWLVLGMDLDQAGQHGGG